MLTVAIVGATAAALAPRTAPLAATPGVGGAAQFSAIRHIVEERCVPCHAPQPAQPGFSAPPKGVLLDTPEAILKTVALMAPQIETRAMPVGNLTGMTDSERAQILDWVRRGAPH